MWTTARVRCYHHLLSLLRLSFWNSQRQRYFRRSSFLFSMAIRVGAERVLHARPTYAYTLSAPI